MSMQRNSNKGGLAGAGGHGGRGDLRIIAGRLRGRRWPFPSVAGLRPTPDRVRETLFNWLAPRIAGARCLDLFAGSGALGLEALSRGASQVTFVEHDREAAKALHARLSTWELTAGTVLAVNAGQVASWAAFAPFDIVFLDPPFDSNLLQASLATLAGGAYLAVDARVYVETPARSAVPDESPIDVAAWQTLRSGKAGEVGYHLLRQNVGGEQQT